MPIFFLMTAILTAAAQIYQGQQQRRATNINADRAAEIEEQQAKAIEEKTRQEEALHRASGERLLSTQRALYGKSGVEFTGTPLLVMADTARQIELDARAIKYGGSIQAAQARNAATLSRTQGSSAAKNAQTASYFSAGTTLLQGAGQAYGAKR